MFGIDATSHRSDRLFSHLPTTKTVNRPNALSRAPAAGHGDDHAQIEMVATNGISALRDYHSIARYHNSLAADPCINAGGRLHLHNIRVGCQGLCSIRYIRCTEVLLLQPSEFRNAGIRAEGDSILTGVRPSRLWYDLPTRFRL